MWKILYRLGLSVCGLGNFDESMNFFDCLLGPFLLIFWMFKQKSLHVLNEVKSLIDTNWLIEQLIIKIWEKLCQIDILIF